MKVVKITVLDTSLREDLVRQFGNPNLKPCGVLKKGDGFRPVTFLLEATDQEAGPFYDAAQDAPRAE